MPIRTQEILQCLINRKTVTNKNRISILAIPNLCDCSMISISKPATEQLSTYSITDPILAPVPMAPTALLIPIQLHSLNGLYANRAVSTTTYIPGTAILAAAASTSSVCCNLSVLISVGYRDGIATGARRG